MWYGCVCVYGRGGDGGEGVVVVRMRAWVQVWMSQCVGERMCVGVDVGVGVGRSRGRRMRRQRRKKDISP